MVTTLVDNTVKRGVKGQPVSQNVSTWVENDTQSVIIFHSQLWILHEIFHSSLSPSETTTKRITSSEQSTNRKD